MWMCGSVLCSFSNSRALTSTARDRCAVQLFVIRFFAGETVSAGAGSPRNSCTEWIQKHHGWAPMDITELGHSSKAAKTNGLECDVHWITGR